MQAELLLHSDLIARIELTLAQLRPYLQTDNGDVTFLKVTDDMIVHLRLEGACSSCAMSMMTLKAGIEQSLLKEIPELKGVKADR